MEMGSSEGSFATFPELGRMAEEARTRQAEEDRRLLAELTASDSGKVAVGGASADCEGLVTSCGD